MAGLRYHFGCAAKGAFYHVKIRENQSTKKQQILSQDLEQADPTVYEIINRVRFHIQQPEPKCLYLQHCYYRRRTARSTS
jgi:hypothetical protein